MDQDGNNRGGDIKDIFCSKNMEYEVLSLYGFSMCTSKMLSTGKGQAGGAEAAGSLIKVVPGWRCLEITHGR